MTLSDVGPPPSRVVQKVHNAAYTKAPAIRTSLKDCRLGKHYSFTGGEAMIEMIRNPFFRTPSV